MNSACPRRRSAGRLKKRARFQKPAAFARGCLREDVGFARAGVAKQNEIRTGRKVGEGPGGGILRSSGLMLSWRTVRVMAGSGGQQGWSTRPARIKLTIFGDARVCHGRALL
jgi:hypothetical protein